MRATGIFSVHAWTGLAPGANGKCSAFAVFDMQMAGMVGSNDSRLDRPV